MPKKTKYLQYNGPVVGCKRLANFVPAITIECNPPYIAGKVDSAWITAGANVYDKERCESLVGMVLLPLPAKDLPLREVAEKAGWYVMREPELPGETPTFANGQKQLWHCSKGWACAEIIIGHYRNHRYYPSLEEALDKESAEKEKGKK